MLFIHFRLGWTSYCTLKSVWIRTGCFSNHKKLPVRRIRVIENFIIVLDDTYLTTSRSSHRNPLPVPCYVVVQTQIDEKQCGKMIIAHIREIVVFENLTNYKLVFVWRSTNLHISCSRNLIALVYGVGDRRATASVGV